MSDQSVVCRIERHQREYDYASLVELYGSAFAARCARIWVKAYGLEAKQTTEKQYYLHLRILRWIANNGISQPDSVLGLVYTHLRDKEDIVSKDQMASAIAAFCASLRNIEDNTVIQSKTKKTRAELIYASNTLLKRLAVHGLYPRIPPSHALGLNDGPFEGRLPSLGELVMEPERRNQLVDNPGHVEIGRGYDGLNLSAHLDKLTSLNEARLNALRECAELDLLDEIEKYRRGKDLIEQARGYPAVNSLAEVGIYEKKYGKDSLEGLLLLTTINLSDTRSSIAPVWYVKFKESMGGERFIAPRLGATPRALMSAQAIVLIDTGFNVESCENLPLDPFLDTVVRGQMILATIKARKARAAGGVARTVMVDGECLLPTKSAKGRLTGVQVIRLWQELADARWELARAKGLMRPDSLWEIPNTRSHSKVLKWRQNSGIIWWPQFLARHSNDPVIGGLKITRAMIRPTVLQIRSGKGDFSHEVAQVLAGHRQGATSMRYLNAKWFRLELSRQIRHFISLYEASLVNDISDVAKELGIAEAVLLQRKSLARETGLGFLCADPEAGVQPSSKAGETCTQLDACHACHLRRFVPTPSAMEALVVFNLSLRDQQDRFLAQNPARWSAIWLPWLALTEAVISKLSAGFYKKQFKRVSVEAVQKLADGRAGLVTLW